MGFKLNRNLLWMILFVLLDDPIKALGVYTIPVKLPHGTEGQVKVWVVKE